MFPEFCTSSIMFFNLSSNSPLYLEPATAPDKSRLKILLPAIVLGTVPSQIRHAMASTIAVLPTPGSPIKHGLFFVLLLNIWIILPISFSRPTTGSSLFAFASAVKSLPYFSKVGMGLA